MFSFEEYLWGWGIYLLSSIGLLMVFWRLTRNMAWFYVKQCLRLMVATLLLTPALVENTSLFLSPAWIQGFLQWVFVGTEGFLPVGRLLLIAFCLMLIIYLLLLIAQQLHQRKATKRSLP